MSVEYKDKKKHKQLKNDPSNRIINKWMSFGGGFYGLMALITFFAIESKEIFWFCIKLVDLKWNEVLSSIGIGLFVELLKNAIMNLVDAFVWFRYWPKQIDMHNGWYWLVAAYLGYSMGAYLAKIYPKKWSLWSIFTIWKNKA